MSIYLKILIFALFGYISGSLPFALWVTRIVKGIDVRDVGSGHVTTTNTIRQAGWGPGLLVFVFDAGKGFLPTFLALRAELPGWAVALTAALAVVGHCWPIFAQFRGGMGLATTGGSFLAVEPIAFVIGLGVLIILVLAIRHAARASLFTGLIIPIVFWAFGFQGTILYVAIAAGLVIAIRFTIDGNRQYRELWLDREGED
jgi:glycerol-3-phosphate acyltransferase PlsY